MRVVVVGAGSNLGARASAIFASARLLDARPRSRVVDVSPFYETPPLGPPQDDYLNAAFRVETDLAPPELLHTLLRIERRLGRRRSSDLRWGPRSIDLDLLWDSRGSFESSELRVPHRELENRSFALGPLLDVAPELADRYGSALDAQGGRPDRWADVPISDETESSSSFERVVEARSLVEACASSVRISGIESRAWATRHLTIPASFGAFAEAVRHTFRTGFQPCCTTVSHCSQTQWDVQFHGADRGLSQVVDVRFEATTGDPTTVSVTFTARAVRHK